MTLAEQFAEISGSVLIAEALEHNPTTKVYDRDGTRVLKFDDGSCIAELRNGLWDIVGEKEPGVWQSLDNDGTYDRDGWVIQ